MDKTFGDSLIANLYSDVRVFFIIQIYQKLMHNNFIFFQYLNFSINNKPLFNTPILMADTEMISSIQRNRNWENTHEDAAGKWLEVNAPSKAATHVINFVLLTVVIGTIFNYT